MGQRHNGGFGREHEARFHEQYGGRARDRQLQGRGDEWRDERWWSDPRERSDFDPDFGRGYDPGWSGSEYPRFGDRDFSSGRELRDPERGQYAGRGYERWTGYGRGFGEGEGFYGGEHAGRGPKGYRRSDERIREDVCDRLTADPQVDASELTVNVKDCEVVLEGSIESRWMKRRAEDCTEDVPGVTQVHNRLQVRSAGDRNRDMGGSRAGKAGNATAASQH